MYIICICVAFTVSPSSQVVGVGQQAVFRCQNLNADIIAWHVNELQELITVNNQPEDPGITVGISLDGTLNTLTIVAQSNYNGTIVVCVAVFIHNQMLDEESSPANLTIQGK